MSNDYIHREDAIRLAEQGQVQGFPWQFQMLIRLPPADVVEVVRCGKCRYCTNNWHSSVYDLCKITGRNVIDTDFCNYGKRREE